MFRRNVARAAVGLALCMSMGLAGGGTAGAASWVPGGAVATGTADGTATTLPTGNVLFAGGRNDTVDATAASALFDPLTRTWTSAGSMAAPHAAATATLAGGFVVVAGGETLDADGISPLRTNLVERYSLAGGQWSAGTPLTDARTFHTATATGGQVLIAGGLAPGDVVLGSSELYDPAGGGSITRTDTMGTARYGAVAVALLGPGGTPDGRVLVAGGFDGNAALSSAEIWTPGPGPGNGWNPTGSMTTAREFATATVLPDGRVLVAGGDDAATPGPAQALTSVEIFDPGTGNWTTGSSMSVARTGASAAAAHIGGRDVVVVAGGLAAGGFGAQSLASTEVYDVIDGTWTTDGSLAAGRGRFGLAGLTALTDGRTLAVGGVGVINDVGARTNGLTSSELFTAATAVSPAPASAAFTSQRVGAPATPRTITVTNSGTTDNMFVTAAAIAGPDSSSFSLTSADTCTNTIVAPGGSCTVEVAFAPHLDRALSASLALTVNSATGTTTVALTGTGLAPRIGTAGLTFGAQTVGTVSAPQLATITNTGTADLHVSGASLAGADFALTGADTCTGATIAPGASCAIGVRFAPQGAGVRTGAVTLADDTIARTTAVALAGTGVGAGAAAGAAPGPGAGAKKPVAKESFRMTCKLVKGSRRTVRCVVSYAGSRKNFSIRARLSRKGAVLARRTSLVRGRSVVMKLTSKRKLRKGRYAVVLVVGNGQRDVTGAVTVR